LAFADQHGYRRRADLGDEFEALLWTAATQLPRWVVDHVSRGGVVIDIGANVGALTAQFCKLVGPSGHVLAVEPIPRNVARLRDLTDLNDLPQLEIIAAAASNRNGAAHIRLPAPGLGSAYASFDVSWIDGGALEVSTVTVDQLVADRLPDIAVTLMKIDVEGHEPAVLEGARTTIATHHPLVMCEFNDPVLRDIGSSVEELLSIFSGLGYTPTNTSPHPRSGHVTDVLLAAARD
jgi:FkbM family methyltransferase